ncbi:MAG: DUF502 domain-containing protein [Flavobacteriales bacterium]|nr:DUF502 domain-containing protein [Flavobacteriales bacterium]
MDQKSLSKRALSYFFRGLLLVAPITIIIYIIYQLFVFLDDLIPTRIPGLGILILLAGITGLGYLGSVFITQPIKNAANRMLARIPLLRTIYTAINDLLSAFVGQKKSFSRPVLVKLNRESDIEKLGFVTNTDLEQLSITSGKIAVYLPHSYNFSGNLYIVPTENITPLDAKTPDVMKFIVSGGVVNLGSTPDEETQV